MLAHFLVTQPVEEKQSHILLILGVRIWGDIFLNTFDSEIQARGGQCSSNNVAQVMESTALILKSTLE